MMVVYVLPSGEITLSCPQGQHLYAELRLARDPAFPFLSSPPFKVVNYSDPNDVLARMSLDVLQEVGGHIEQLIRPQDSEYRAWAEEVPDEDSTVLAISIIKGDKVVEEKEWSYEEALPPERVEEEVIEFIEKYGIKQIDGYPTKRITKRRNELRSQGITRIWTKAIVAGDKALAICPFCDQVAVFKKDPDVRWFPVSSCIDYAGEFRENEGFLEFLFEDSQCILASLARMGFI